MKTNIITVILVIIGLFVGCIGGYQLATINADKEKIKNINAIDSLSKLIADRSEIIKYDTIIVQGERSIDTIKIYYKIKQNAQKLDTTAIAIVNRFDELLTANRNRENKGSK